MRQGLLAAFKEANDKGGVGGRKLELITYDDGYEPEKAIANTNKLINEDKVFALIGEVGTPTSKAVQPIASEAKVPFVGPFTGAEFLRNPHKPYVVNVRGSYFQETEAIVEHLTGNLDISRIAIFYQDDSYGRAGLAGVQKALDKRSMELVSEGTYKRNTTAIKSAVLSIRKGKPQAVIMIGAYKPCAEFIKVAHKVKMDSVFVNISFVGSKALAKELGDAAEGVMISQVVPLPWDDSIPLVADYQTALKAADADAEVGFVSLEGYMVGRLAIQALEKTPGEPTRQAFLDAIATTGTFDLGGVNLVYSAGDNQGMDQVFLTAIQPDHSFTPVQVH